MRRHGFISLVVLSVVPVAFAQQSQTGLPPFGTFQDGQFDAVNLENLNVVFSIPLVSNPGRGLNLPLALSYNGLNWTKQTCGTNCSPAAWWAPATVSWSLIPMTSPLGPSFQSATEVCETSQEEVTHYFGFVFWDSIGTAHFFDIDYYSEATSCNFPTGPKTGMATDGSGYYMDASGSLVVYSRSGILGGTKDTNGNYVSTSVNGSGVRTYLDTLGRTALKITPGTGYWDYEALDPSGNPQVSRLNLQNFSVKTNFGCSGVVEYTSSASGPFPVSFVLPNGQSYTFEYEATPGYSGYITGRLKKVTLPTGGSYEYQYPGNNGGMDCTAGETLNLTRIINGGSSSSTWQYARSSSVQSGQTVWKTVMTAPVLPFDNGVANQTTCEFKPFWTTQAERDRTEKVYQGTEATGTLLRTVVTNSIHPCPPRRITTTLPNGLQSKVETDFDCTTGLLLETREHDWHSTTPPLRRKTTLSYLNSSAYTSRNIIDRVSQILVRDGSGNIQSKTTLAYDGTSLTSVTGAAQHDDSNYGSSFTTRGNPSSITTYTDAAAETGGITRTLYYDTLGNLRKEEVGGTQQREWAYSSTTQYAYPASVTLGPSSGSQLTTSATYSFYTGQVLTATDANNKTTEFAYDDLGRLTTITRPDDAEITYDYNNSNREITVESPIQGTDRLREKTFFDELGRPFKAQVSDGSGGNCSSAETQYDPLGRALRQSNPIGCGSTPVYWTETRADALGRPKLIVPPDGGATANRTVYSYSENSAMVTDPTGKQRRSYTDALGRLIQVDEPAGSAATPAKAGTGSASVSGTLQTAAGTLATPGTGTVTIGGTEQSWSQQVQVGEECVLWFEEVCLDWDPIYEWQIAGWDSGGVSITVNGLTKSVSYSQSSTASTIASALASAFNADSGSSVNASANSGVVTLTSKTNGASTNYSLSATSWTNDTQHFSSPSFTATRSGATLTGGADATSTTYDSGSAWVTVNGFQASVSYGQGSTASSVASAIVVAFNSNPSSPVFATAAGSTISLGAKQTGTASNYSLSKGSSTSLPGMFSQPSFSLSASGTALTGGGDATDSLASSPHVTQYAYSVLDSLTTVTQGDQTRTYTYDSLGRVTGVATPETKHSGTQKWVTNQYNSFGRVTQRTDPRGVITSNSYDTLNRLTQMSYNVSCCSTVPSASTVSYTYGTSTSSNNNGRLITVTDGVGSESYTYDQLGQITQVQKVISSTTYTTGYEYNLAGAIKKTTYPSNRQVQQTFDAKGRLASVYAGSTTYVNGFSYNTASQVTALSYGNGVAASFGFNAARLQLESLSYTNGSTTLLSLAYGYTQGGGNNGQITSITDGTGTQEGGRSVTYTYDALHRLKTAETTGSTNFPKWGLQWTYDRYGNRTQQSILSGCQSPMTCPTNSVNVSTSTNRFTDSPYAYDENGNMTNDGLNTLTFDAESRVVRVNSSNPMYVYDGAGLRVKKCDPHCTSPTTTTVYIFSGTKVIAEYVNGSLSKEYVYSGTTLVATHEGSTLKYHHADHLSPRVTSDGTSGSPTFGQKVADSGHFPYGENWYESGGTNKWKFASYQRDSESGNDFAIFRFYSTRSGRFCSVDRLAGRRSDPQSLNRFAYVRSDPINRADPLGMVDESLGVGCYDAYDVHVVYDSESGEAVQVSVQYLGVWCLGGYRIKDEKILDAFRAAAQEVATLFRSAIPEECAEDLEALGVSAEDLAIGASDAQFINGAGSSVPLSELYEAAPNDAVRRNAASVTGTVGDVLAKRGTVAVAQLNGRNIYVNPQHVDFPNFDAIVATAFHETVHNVTGLTDPDIQKALGLPEEASNNISRRLFGSCFGLRSNQ